MGQLLLLLASYPKQRWMGSICRCVDIEYFLNSKYSLFSLSKNEDKDLVRGADRSWLWPFPFVHSIRFYSILAAFYSFAALISFIHSSHSSSFPPHPSHHLIHIYVPCE